MASPHDSSQAEGAEQQLQSVLDELGTVENELSHVRTRIDSLVQQQESLLSKKQELKTKADQLQTLCQRLESARGDFEKSDFGWSVKLHELKKSVFGIESLRAMQEQVINTTMSGRDCLIVMPTGAGKSLCYQLPALLSNGITLIVSPLVSLMEDQTIALEQLGIPAAFLSASTPPEKLKETNASLLDPDAALRLLYVTPEKIAKSKRFMAQLQKCYNKGRLARIAIDEVHCCSQWGHDFRPDYKMLGVLKRQFPEVPVLGLTATATASVLDDVKTLLNLHACVTLRSSYNRANLYYQVRAKPSSQEDLHQELVNLINGQFKGESGIIYCLSRKNTEQLASALRKSKIQAEPYHAELDAGHRSAVHVRWKNGKTQVVVATIAFGMGIDKPDVRFVIHQSLSKSLENYYQESGRAGRDDKPAECILFFNSADVFRQSSMVMVEQTGLVKLYAMVAYCINHVRLQSFRMQLLRRDWKAISNEMKNAFPHIPILVDHKNCSLFRCRRGIQAEHFDESHDTSQQQCNAMCDNCRHSSKVEDIQLNEYCATLLDILQQKQKKKERITPLKLIDLWLAKKPVLKAVSGTELSVIKRIDCQLILCFLLLEGYLKEDFHFTPYTTIVYIIPGPKSTLILSEPILYKYRLGPTPPGTRRPADVNKAKMLTDAKKTGQSAEQTRQSTGLSDRDGKRPMKRKPVGQKVTGKGDVPTKKRKDEVIVIS